MTHWRKVRTVAQFELSCAVRSKSWLIVTFGMPVFLLLYAGLVSIPIMMEGMKQRKVTVYGLVDETGLLGLEADVRTTPVEVPAEIRAALEKMGETRALEGGMAWIQNIVFRPFPDPASAGAAMKADRIRGYYRLPRDYVATGIVESWSPEVSDITSRESRQALSGLIVERLLRGNLPDELAARVRRPVADTRSWILTSSGEVKQSGGAGRMVRLIVPVGFAVLLLMSIMMSAGGLAQATGVEKENKVVEVLLSSVAADEILMGKLLGLGVAGLLQMGVWFGMVALAGVGFTGALAAIGVEPPWGAIAAAVVLFPLTYLFFGSLILGTGSLGATEKQAQQWGMIWALLAVVPMMFLGLLLHEPHGTAGRVLSWLPFSSPIVLVVRLALDPAGVAWWELAGGITVLVGATWFAIRVGARLFRVGILLTGARPKLREILRQARLS